MKAPVAILAAALAFGSGCAAGTPTWRGPSHAHQQALLADAERFMADYAERLRSADRAGIAALYDPEGSILVRDGRRIVATKGDMVQRYARPQWQPPVSFEWRDLHYEAAGADAVIVLGKFAWQSAEGPISIGTYNALLRRYGDRLVIRIEDEAADQSAR